MQIRENCVKYRVTDETEVERLARIDRRKEKEAYHTANKLKNNPGEDGQRHLTRKMKREMCRRVYGNKAFKKFGMKTMLGTLDYTEDENQKKV